MPVGTIILLGAFAGLTIYLGLPLAFLKSAPQTVKNFASMFATGILLFLFYDVVGKASEPIGGLIDEVRSGHAGSGPLILDISLFIGGLLIGLIGLVYFNKYITSRIKWRAVAPKVALPVAKPEPALVGVGTNDLAAAGVVSNTLSTKPGVSAVEVASPATRGELPAQTLAMIIATGIGLHNFSEGLAIGQSAAIGALQLALVLIIGFGLHNMTEGFGIAGPLTNQSQRVSWKFLALVGLIGGGPTFLGTIVGVFFHSDALFIFCLALAAGAILYVVAELLGVAKRFKAQDIVMWGLLAGFLLGYLTDLIVTFAGA